MLRGLPVVALVLLSAWALGAAVLLLAYRRELVRLLREPVFRRPVLVIESDDWGAGPISQAASLQALAQVLQRHRDGTGRAPVLSLALVLAVPDGPAIARDGRYRRVELDDPRFAPVRAALQQGAAQGVFALQLHGMEHYWPEALAASRDPAVQAWLRQPVPAATEQLPSHLQSRWVDAGTLPSAQLAGQAIAEAAAQEVRAFARIFGAAPCAVVPPTFVWTRAVEQAWSAAGVEFVVTPGFRSTQRNAQGLPDGDEGPIVNGSRAGSLTYLVRSDYFEPARGRDAEYALRALVRGAAEGRPCVLENHRDNFIFDGGHARQSLAELDVLCAGALRRCPQLRFLSTAELGRILRDRDPQWLAASWRERLPLVWQRLRGSGRLWKLMRLSGLAGAGQLLVRLLGPQPAARGAAPRS